MDDSLFEELFLESKDDKTKEDKKSKEKIKSLDVQILDKKVELDNLEKSIKRLSREKQTIESNNHFAKREITELVTQLVSENDEKIKTLINIQSKRVQGNWLITSVAILSSLFAMFYFYKIFVNGSDSMIWLALQLVVVCIFIASSTFLGTIFQHRIDLLITKSFFSEKEIRNFSFGKSIYEHYREEEKQYNLMKNIAIAGFFLSFIFIAVNTSQAMDKTSSRAIKIDTDDLMVNQNLMKGVERYNQELRKNNV
jgi:cation transport ATPase